MVKAMAKEFNTYDEKELIKSMEKFRDMTFIKWFFIQGLFFLLFEGALHSRDRIAVAEESTLAEAEIARFEAEKEIQEMYEGSGY